MANIQIGGEYVFGGMVCGTFVPTCCNSQYSPQHPCRVKVEKLGSKYAQVFMSGDRNRPSKVQIGALFDVEDAKRMYREALSERDAMWAAQGGNVLGKARIDELVAGL